MLDFLLSVLILSNIDRAKHYINDPSIRDHTCLFMFYAKTYNKFSFLLNLGDKILNRFNYFLREPCRKFNVS